MQIPQAAIDPGLNNMDQQRWGSVQTLVRVANRLGRWLIMPSEGISEPLKADNALWLAQGEQGGGSLSAARTRVAGASGAVLTRTLQCASTATLTGVDFTNSDNNDCLSLGADSVTVLVGCTFRNDTSDGGVLVKAAAGAKAKFIGCTFHGSGLSQVVDNPGLIGDIVLDRKSTRLNSH